MENNTQASKKKVLNNNAIGILLVLNILIGMVNMVENLTSNDIAHAQVDNSNEEAKRKDNENEVDLEGNEATHKVVDVDNATEQIGTTKLYYAHGNGNEAWFTARETSSPNEIQADWYIDKKTLAKANIELELLSHNDTVEVVYVVNELYEYFEIVAVK